ALTSCHKTSHDAHAKLLKFLADQ
ncbi:MAG: hypothetical protein QOE53_2416, partial [Pseudonocardiales bacterium]|nr:hypothetical protein [Pseudonocardiales bacterium]